MPVDLALVGDAGLTLDALLDEVNDRLDGKPRDRLAAVAARDRRPPQRSGSASGCPS